MQELQKIVGFPSHNMKCSLSRTGRDANVSFMPTRYVLKGLGGNQAVG
jgi:hypothetical protein